MAMNELTGRRLRGKYRVLQLIGAGAMGQVYLAQAAHGLVALKVLRPELASDARFTERFMIEARSLETLRHPHIVSAYDHFIEDGCCCIVLEHVEGQSLAERIDRDGAMSVTQATDILVPVLDALNFAHLNGFIHRDVKPSNILLDRKGQPKLCDFGIAREIGARRLTAVGRSVGTPEYMSPEQFTGRDVLHTSDVYSAGVVLFELLTGRMPFSGSAYELAQKHTHEAPPEPAALNRAVSRDLSYVVLKALRKDPNRRFRGCADFAQALAAQRPGGKAQATASAPQQQQQQGRRHIYEVYHHSKLAPQAIEQGFSLPALAFNLIWMWRHGLYGRAAFWCTAYLALLLVCQAAPDVQGPATLAALVLLFLPARRGNQWRAAHLTQLGYRRTTTVLAATAESALLAADGTTA